MSIYNLEIPKELIAKYPRNNNSKLLALNIKDKIINTYDDFNTIVDFFKANDVLVFNDTKVINARFYAYKDTGAKVEILLLEKISSNSWKAMLGGKKINKDLVLYYSDDTYSFKIKIIEHLEKGVFIILFLDNFDIYKFLDLKGELPLPPYIDRAIEDIDKIKYQTIFAKNYGSVAAPTAAFHFNESILEKLRQKGVDINFLTLHVSYGTFSKVLDINTHSMHSEEYKISLDLANKIKLAKQNKRRVIAVGTTVTRSLETLYLNKFKVLDGSTNILIKTGFKFNVVDVLITNFHLPSTTLIHLVSAFSSEALIEQAYLSAIKNNFYFLSYGDAMILYNR